MKRHLPYIYIWGIWCVIIGSALRVDGETIVPDTVVLQKSKPARTDSDTVPEAKNLDELVVERSNVIQHGNVDSHIITPRMRKESFNAGELLNNIAGMDYNRMDETLTYLGSSNVVLLVDSIPKDASYIKRQSPNRFDRIDIVQHPGGEYRGYDVLINFHPRPHYSGFESNVRIPVTIWPNGYNGKGKDLKSVTTYIDGTYILDRLTISITASWDWFRNGSSLYSSTEYPLNGYKETMLERDKNDPVTMFRRNKGFISLAGDYKFNDRHKISVLWQTAPQSNQTSKRYDLKIIDRDEENQLNVFLNDGQKDILSNTLGFYYSGKFGDWRMNATANFSSESWKTNYHLLKSNGYNLLYDHKIREKYMNATVSINRSFMESKWNVGVYGDILPFESKESDLETGLLLAQSRIAKSNFIGSVTYSPNSKLNLYVDGGVSIGSHNDSGIRLTEVMPRVNVNINWLPTDKIRVNAYYLISSGMSNPIQIQSYGQFVDRFKYQEGNPYLKPTVYPKAYLGITLWHKFMIYGQYEFPRNSIYNIYSAANSDPENPADGYYYALGKYQNGKARTLTLGASVNQKLGKGFTFGFNGQVRRESAIYETQQNSVWIPAGTTRIMYFNGKYNFASELRYSLISYSSVTPQQYLKGLSDYISLIVQKEFLKRKLKISLLWTLPVHITNGDIKGKLISPAMIQTSWGNEQFRTNNQLGIHLSYRFTTGKQVRKLNLEVQTVESGSRYN